MQANTSFHHIKFHESWFLQENFQKYLYIDQKTTEYEDAMPMFEMNELLSLDIKSCIEPSFYFIFLFFFSSFSF